MNSALKHSRSPVRSQQAGFSLLEVLVAFAIMAMALSMLYQVLGNNVRAVAVTGEYQRAAMLAQSLLNAHDGIPPQGWNESGESGGFRWSAAARPYETGVKNQFPEAVPLYEVLISVTWQEAGKSRDLTVTTLKPQRTIESRGG